MKSALNRVCLKGRASDADIMTAVCLSLGAQGVEVVDHETDPTIAVGVTCVIAWHSSEHTHDDLYEIYSETCQVPVTIEIRSQSLDTWRDVLAGADPQPIGSRFIISETPIERPRHKVIRIKQGLGFGGGRHGTTQISVDGMEMVFDREPSIRRVADIGTGTGILALIAAHLGAKEVVATDIDSVARQGASHHVTENGFEGVIRVETNLEGETRAFDLVVANLYLPDLIENIPTIANAVRAGGYCVVSGFTQPHLEDIKKRLAQVRLLTVRTFERANWSAIVGYRAS